MMSEQSASTSGRESTYDEVCRTLSRRWPGRQEQILQLLDYLWESSASVPPLLVYGGPSTGKTAIVRDVFNELRRPYCYVNCVEYDKCRQLLQALLDRLKGKKRKCANGYACDGKAEHIADFIVHLQGLAAGAGSGNKVLYIVLDHVERIAAADVLPVLLRLREMTGAKLGLVLISQVAWGLNVYEHDTLRCPKPHQLFFPGYRMQDLLSILELSRPEGGDMRLFRQFLSTFIGPMFARCSSRIEDLQMVIELLYPEYARPVAEGTLAPDARQALFLAFKDKAVAARVAFEAGLHNQVGTSADGLAGCRANGSAASSFRLDFELPFSAKFLLLAAYVASRNKPMLDRRLFDPSARSGRRRGAMASDKQAEAAAEAKLKGPHPFPLERLLGIFWELHAATGEEALDEAERQDLQSADVLMQISSLVSLRFLSQVSGGLDERKYACNVSDALAERIARNVKVNLKDYVFYV